jgi:hypothetical protein
MSDPILYQDGLVTILHDAIVLKRHTFFNFGTRRIPFAETRTIVTEVPSLRTGKWRIQGTGDLNTWYPLDWKRPSRDTSFIITLKARQMRVGFTVEDSQQVMTILSDKGLLSSASA